ncbi:MAG: DUF4097 family beta strand repeat-containing protein [Chthoniobacterales bacterium]
MQHITAPLSLSIALLLSLSVSSAWALSEQTRHEQFDCAAGGKLVVDVDFGTIDVATGPDGKVTVEAYRKIDASDEAREKEYFAATPMLVSMEGNTVTIRTRRQNRESSWKWSGNITMDARYTVHVPAAFQADLRTSGGSISASGVTGAVKADTSGGKLKFSQLHGPLDARTSGGSIALDDCDGDLKVSTSGGAIDANRNRGRLDARTSGGAIAVRGFVGDTEVKTSGGRLTLENMTGNVSGKTAAGSISCSLTDRIAGDVELQTSAGSIEVTVPPRAGANVEARTSMGRVRTEIPMLATRSNDDRLEGTLNGGGKTLTLKASVGSITIKPGPEATAAAPARP